MPYVTENRFRWIRNAWNKYKKLGIELKHQAPDKLSKMNDSVEFYQKFVVVSWLVFYVIWQIRLPIFIVNNKVDEDDFIPMLAVTITYWILWIVSVSTLAMSVKNNSRGNMIISVVFLYLRSLISMFDIEKSRKYI